MKRKICIFGLVLMLLCAASCSDASGNSDAAQGSVTDMETVTSSGAEVTLPEEVKNALFAYLNSDSYDALAESILPTAVAEQAKNGKGIAGNYYFGIGPCICENVNISQCSRMTKDRAERLAAFWATGFSLQGFDADFTAEDGYDVVVSADALSVFNDTDTEIPSLSFTRWLSILKIEGDRWIVVPAADSPTDETEQAE